MDGLRVGVRDVRGLDGDIVFKVHDLVLLGDYALASVTPLNPDGSPIPAYEDSEDMPCDTHINALLQRTSADGWMVIEREVGPCDYAWPYIFEQNQSYPAALLREWENVADPEAILGITLPTDISSLVAELGEPTEVELPDEEDPSPWGQWFRWDQQDGAATFSAVGDDYSPSIPNRTAAVRFIDLRSKGKGPPIKTIHGFDLNLTTRSEVESILRDLVQPSASIGLDPEGDLYGDTLKYQQDGLFTFFLFGPDGHLTRVVQATFDAEFAD